MLFGLVVVIHVGLALFMIVIILLQGGRGGLGETMGGAAAQSLFGGGANTVMTKLTAVVAGMFMITSLGLAALSTSRGRSVIDRLPADALPIAPPAAPSPDAQTPQPIELSVPLEAPLSSPVPEASTP
jgi:preprotein translocase subunit SecG